MMPKELTLMGDDYRIGDVASKRDDPDNSIMIAKFLTLSNRIMIEAFPVIIHTGVVRTIAIGSESTLVPLGNIGIRRLSIVEVTNMYDIASKIDSPNDDLTLIFSPTTDNFLLWLMNSSIVSHSIDQYNSV
jgi:hypothetical protein